MDKLGRFVIRGELGKGAYSVVYEAVDGERDCALRVLEDDAVPDEPVGRAALASALRGMTQLEHPSVVSVLDAGEEDGRLFVEMELMRAPTLAEKLEEQGSLPEKQAVLFVRQMSLALDKARDVGYFHGNLNAENVFVVSEDKVKLSDFAVRSFVENPELAAEFGSEREIGVDEPEQEWVTAEQLLASKAQVSGTEELEEDFTSLGALMMQMFGMEVAKRGDSGLEDYRSELVQGPLAQLESLRSERGDQVTAVIRRLLSPGAFESMGEVVVELAGTTLLSRRSAGGGEPAPVVDKMATIDMRLGDEEALLPEVGSQSDGGVEPLEFDRDTREAVFTPFFTWDSKRGGKFFVVHDGERLSLGRDPDFADVVLIDPALSRRHCIFSREGSAILVEDLGSTNGTFVNGKRVERAELNPGDTVRIGVTVISMSLLDRQG
ncbi:MAG: FHA domain-containing protein [Planctomycetes bacterium]|nr:FHA domain-containing protein [Planctomycetota bacterium]